MKTFLLLIYIFALPVSLLAQTNSAAYDQLISQAGSQIAGGNLDAAKQTAQQALQLDGQNWRGNALMAAILQKQSDFTNAQIYIQKAIATAPADKKDKLNAMAQTIAAGAAQSAPAVSGEMSPEARIKYDGLMVIAQDADKATTEDDRKQALREFMAKSAAFLEMEPDQTNVWVMRALIDVELNYPTDGFYMAQKLKDLQLEESDDPNVRKAFAELALKDWLKDRLEGGYVKNRDWSKWTRGQVVAAAYDGDEEAQYCLGSAYSTGSLQGSPFGYLEQNYDKARFWLERAADSGDYAASGMMLGEMFQNGWGVGKDYAQALAWYRKAATQGNVRAMGSIVKILTTCIDSNFRKETVKWENNLSMMYQNDHEYANKLYWNRKAAAQGNAVAQYGLGEMYQYGQGVTQDYAQALDWYRKAVAQGQVNAQNSLGIMYQNGYGVEKDIAIAKDWYQKAAAQGFQPAKDALSKLDQNSQ